MVEAEHTELDKALQQTKELVANSAIPAIFEATFQHDDVLVRVDVLKRSGACAGIPETGNGAKSPAD